MNLIIVLFALELAVARGESFPVVAIATPMVVNSSVRIELPILGTPRCDQVDKMPDGLWLEGCVLTGIPSKTGNFEFEVAFRDERRRLQIPRILTFGIEVRLLGPILIPEGIYLAKWEPGGDPRQGVLIPGRIMRFDSKGGMFSFVVDPGSKSSDREPITEDQICLDALVEGRVKALFNGLPALRAMCSVNISTAYVRVPRDLKTGTTATIQVLGAAPDGQATPSNILALPVVKE